MILHIKRGFSSTSVLMDRMLVNYWTTAANWDSHTLGWFSGFDGPNHEIILSHS